MYFNILNKYKCHWNIIVIRATEDIVTDIWGRDTKGNWALGVACVSENKVDSTVL